MKDSASPHTPLVLRVPVASGDPMLASSTVAEKIPKSMNYIRIVSIDHLVRLIRAGHTSFITAHGILRCSREIWIGRSASHPFHVYSLVDDSSCDCNIQDLTDLFQEAISHRAFYLETTRDPSSIPAE